MHVKPEQINLADTESSRLPLCFKKILLKDIPPIQVENKLMLYNDKYKFDTMMIVSANKPISKILN